MSGQQLYHRASRGGLFVQREHSMAPGPNNQLLYGLDETASPWANLGLAGSLDLTATSGTPTAYRTALFSRGVDFNGNSGGTTDSIATANTSTGEASASCSMSIWVCFWSFNSTFASIFGKQYRGNGTWTTPFNSLKIGLTNTTTGTWECYVTVSGTGTSMTMSGLSDVLRLGRWHLLATTFEKNSGGSKLRAYLDGTLVGTSASLGNNAVIDWGTHGRWYIGGNPQATGDYCKARLDDARFDTEAFDEAYWTNMYRTGYGLYEGAP